jgi:hypothetical protein
LSHILNAFAFAWVNMQTYSVRDTAEAFYLCKQPWEIFNLFSPKSLETPPAYLMDPRRVRDPRLARSDPRQTTAGQHAPTPPPASNTSSSPQWSENGLGSALPPAQLAYQSAQHPSNPSPASEFTTPPSSSDTAPETPQYKPRPLFCVVCASNQASN